MSRDFLVTDVPSTPIELSWVLPLYRTSEQLDELLSRIHDV